MALALKSARTGVRPAAASRRSVVVQASSRPLWLPGNPAPAYLNGTLAGDFGFDPLGLGKDPEALRWYVQAELIHCRTAMAAVAGILIPGLMTKAGLLNVPEWYDAGKISAETSFTTTGTLIVAMHYLYGFAEGKRWMDFKKPKSQGEPGSFVGLEGALAGSGENAYPGGPFDPMGFSADPAKLQDMKWKEVRNGRLAMMAFLGFVAQHAATGKGPIDNLADHLKDPWHTTFADNGVSVPFL